VAIFWATAALCLAGGGFADVDERSQSGSHRREGTAMDDRAALKQRVVDIDDLASELGEKVLAEGPSEADIRAALDLQKELRALAARARSEFPDLEEELRHQISEAGLDLAYVIRRGGEGPMSLRLGRLKSQMGN
jgi:hypothetical protein